MGLSASIGVSLWTAGSVFGVGCSVRGHRGGRPGGAVGEPSHDQTLFAANGVAFRKGRKSVAMVETKSAAQDALIVLLARSGLRGLVRVPHDEDECRRVRDRYSDLVGRREMRVRELIQLRTAEEDMQGRIYEILMPMFERRQ